MRKAKYSEKFFEIAFSDNVSKQAYLKACKWLAQKVYSKDELSKYVSVQIRKEERQVPTFIVSLYISVDENDLKIEYCNKCKSLRSLLYSVEEPDCSCCKMSGYRKHLENNVVNLVKFWKEVFESDEKL